MKKTKAQTFTTSTIIVIVLPAIVIIQLIIQIKILNQLVPGHPASIPLLNPRFHHKEVVNDWWWCLRAGLCCGVFLWWGRGGVGFQDGSQIVILPVRVLQIKL
jgi:hypothetical protein